MKKKILSALLILALVISSLSQATQAFAEVTTNAESQINGVALTQNAVNTSAGYSEAGLMVNWFQNQVTDISTMEWIAIEYYNPTGAAWPFVFKLQCGGQQVYTNNNAVQYTLLDSNFQVTGTKTSPYGYVEPGVSTSGWLVFPRAIFGGIDNLSGALQAMYLLLPCQAANQNNVTELHFGRIMSYATKTVSDYSQGTVVADLSTWEESYLNSTYAATGVGDGNVPLVTIKKVQKPIVHVSGITLNKDNVRIAVGATDTLVASVTPGNADNKTVIWESSDESVAAVSQSGVVSAISIGTTVVTATTADGEFVASCTVTVTEGGMLFDDSYMEKEFNYCPSIMQVDDNTRYIYYCANKDSEQVSDHIYCRRGTKGVDGEWRYGVKTLVLSPTVGAYDSLHCCDPSVIKGDFNYNGTKYSYLMAYTGNSDQVNNKVGLAVSNDPMSGWVKIPDAFRVYTGSASDWGYGQPSLISIDKKSEVLLFYSVGTSTESYTQVETWDLSDLNNPKLKTSIKMTQNGLTDMNGNTGDYLTNGDFAYDPVEERYYCISDAHPFPEEGDIPVFVTKNCRITYLNVKGTYLGEVFTTPDASAGKRWHTLATVGPNETGFDRNSNGGIVTDEYGWILSEEKIEIGYTGSTAITESGIWDWLWSYRIYSWVFSVDEQEDVVDSKLNGIVLTQNAIQTVNGQPQYNEAGIFASYHWFANQVQDLSRVQWVAVEYYNPTGAAWPFILKLQSTGQQVYAQDTNVPYHILTSNFQYVESKTVGAGGLISPGVNTSGWLLFPRSVFGGAPGVTLDTFGTGSLEALSLLLPCTQANQNNITELHFGRIFTYTDSAVPYTDNGTVVADLSTWNKSMTAGTYAYTNTGDNGQPLVTIRCADAVSEPCDANQDLYFDSRDIVRMKRHMASPSTIYILRKKSDLDYNGAIDNNDLAIMRNNLLAYVSYLP